MKLTREKRIKLYLSDYRRLTKAQQKALDAIGSHRKTNCPIGNGKRVSTRTYNALVKKGLAMGLEYGAPMLTSKGEYLYTALHPNSKYRIF